MSPHLEVIYSPVQRVHTKCSSVHPVHISEIMRVSCYVLAFFHAQFDLEKCLSVKICVSTLLRNNLLLGVITLKACYLVCK